MDIPIINQRLKDLYGKDFLDQPIYRVVWSGDQVEKRFSTFRDFVPNTNILLREVAEVRECKKYNYLEPQWILEKLFINHHNKEILDNDTLAPSSCTYEPLWAFGFEPSGRARRPVWRAIELILASVNNPKKLTPSEMNDKEFEQAREDEKLMLDLLNEHIPNDSLHTAIQDGAADIYNLSPTVNVGNVVKVPVVALSDIVTVVSVVPPDPSCFTPFNHKLNV